MYLSEDDYRTGLQALVELHRRGGMRLTVASRWVRVHVVDRDDIGAMLRDHNLDADDVDQLRADVADVILAAVTDVSVDRFAERRSNPRRELPGVKPEQPEVARRKFEMTARAFDITALRDRFWIKQTSKTDVLYAVAWEVAAKMADADRARSAAAPVPFGTLKLGLRG